MEHLIIWFLGKGNILIKLTLIYLGLLGIISVALDFSLLGWKLLLVFAGWFIVISQYLHIKNKNIRLLIQNDVQSVLEKESFNFVDYKKSLKLIVGKRTCDVLVAIHDDNLKVKLQDKWFIPISRIKGLHRKKIGSIDFLCFRVLDESYSIAIDFCIENDQELTVLLEQ